MEQPVLETSRLTLRPFVLADSSRVQVLAGDAKVAATTAAIPHPYLQGMAEQWIGQHAKWFAERSTVAFAIVPKNLGEVIGCVSLAAISDADRRAELGYWIGVDFWSQGYCTEAAKAIVDYGFDSLNLGTIIARHLSINPASGRVMQKCGFKHLKVLPRNVLKNGVLEDVELYALKRG